MEELERLRALFHAEGLFAAERKRPLPLLPRRVGLISGRASAALRDVTVNARLRWPSVDFEIREVAVQGVAAVPAIVEALNAAAGAAVFTPDMGLGQIRTTINIKK